MAAAFSLVLVAVGVLKFGDSGAAAKVKPLGQKMLAKVITEVKALPTFKHDTEPTVQRTVSPQVQNTNQGSSMQSPTLPAKNTLTNTDRKEFICSSALAFLKTHTGKGVVDIEDQFSDFLKHELGVEQSEAERLIRMCFWKNFVTLQHQWKAEEDDRMHLAFTREKELKQAGFAARGLYLMESEIREAEARLQELQQELSLPDVEGERS